MAKNQFVCFFNFLQVLLARQQRQGLRERGLEYKRAYAVCFRHADLGIPAKLIIIESPLATAICKVHRSWLRNIAASPVGV
jgi:hypothetical protein